MDTLFYNAYMNKKFFYIICHIFLLFVFSPCVIADSYEDAEYYIYDAENADSLDEKYENVYQARKIYNNLYQKNPKDIKAILGLYKTYKMSDDPAEAKVYVLKAYNLKPLDPAMQRELGDYYYYIQEYSTAIHYYNKALSSGYLLDFYTNYYAAKCYAKLGEVEQAKLYYQVCNYIDPDFLKYILKKENLINDVDDDSPIGNLENPKRVPEPESVDENDIDSTIEEMNKMYVIPERTQVESDETQESKNKFNLKLKKTDVGAGKKRFNLKFKKKTNNLESNNVEDTIEKQTND